MDYKRLCKFNIVYSGEDYYLIVITDDDGKEHPIKIKDLFAPENELIFLGLCYIKDSKEKVPELDKYCINPAIDIFWQEYIIAVDKIGGTSGITKDISIIFHSNSGNEYTVELPKIKEMYPDTDDFVKRVKELYNDYKKTISK